MKHLIPYIILTIFVGIILLGVKFGKPPKQTNYEQKYDSLQQQLQLERTIRIHLCNTVDSLHILSDSLLEVSNKIKVEIRYLSGKYNKYNSEELQQKMIEAYEQR